MFRKLLIANRGEIAVRVVRACRDLGISTVGVYSEADRDAPFLDWMDEAYLLGGSAPAESYLNVGRLMQVARQSGADALHPGYGFLSESPALASACAEEGVVFVGPSPTAIELMGDKAVSRRIAREAGVPLVPGTEPVSDPAEVRRFAAEHGFPIAVKAVAGGGGRGLRVIRGEVDIEQGLETARREGQLYFGNPAVYLERYLDGPKHVEVQLLGACTGEVLTFGERDCSVQRRHQKLIEEAPGPTVGPQLRARMEDAARRLAERVGYKNAGTVEFLLDRDGSFYFLEMNTRIQVEHPVTEMVRGVDLVAMQIMTAAGDEVPGPGPIDGHAIECRINAESVARGFRPAPGTLLRLREPGGPGVRVDSAMEQGYTIPPQYDSMIAKLVVWGHDRDQARRRMLRALREYVVEGVPTTIPAHEWILQQPEFITGQLATSFLEASTSDMLRALPPEADAAGGSEAEQPVQCAVVEVNGRRFQVSVHGLAAPSVSAAPKPSKPRLASHAATGRGGGDVLHSPIQGNVLRVAVEVGQHVRKGDLVCVVEAMKMENEVPAQKDGTVRQVMVQAGQAVASGDPLAEIGD